jgi:nitrite reductase/ring-hydroxylating ferredoxin subunit
MVAEITPCLSAVEASGEPSPQGYAVADWLEAWYLVCGSHTLKPGDVRAIQLGDRRMVLYRGRDDGQVHAVDPQCPHMGASLAQGRVRGDHLRCALHHWEFDGGGRCVAISRGRKASSGMPRLRTWPVVEQHGGIFVFNGRTATFPPPRLTQFDAEDFLWGYNPPDRVRCHWSAVMSNGFDSEHLETVHGRSLLAPPAIQRLDAHRLQLSYRSRVSGNTLADRLTKWLSGEEIKVSLTCYGGPVMLVESVTGGTHSAMILSLLPTEDGTRFHALVGVRKRRLGTGLRLRVVRGLLRRFLRSDVAPMEGMRFNPFSGYVRDPYLLEAAEFLQSLPPASMR